MNHFPDVAHTHLARPADVYDSCRNGHYQILYIAYTVIGLLCVKYGLGQHLDDVPPSHRPQSVMWRSLASIFYIAISAIVKVAVGLFLLRICTHSRWQRITLWSLIGIVSLFNAFYIFIAIFACQPVAYQWTRYDPVFHEGRCNSTLFSTIPTYISAFLNILADLILPLLPASLVWRAKMERRKKISVCAVMALGSLYAFRRSSSPSPAERAVSD